MIDAILRYELIPTLFIRWGIRALLWRRLAEERARPREAFLEAVRSGPIALATEAANGQHYELPVALYHHMLGPKLKYSCGLFETGAEDLAAAEEGMLTLTMERAGLEDGQRVLELGCGWGSLTLTMAQRFPKSSFTAVSNSRSQKTFIDGECARRGLSNVRVITADMNEFSLEETFDRIVSVQMFEHMRNVPELFRRVARWLSPQGRLFLEVFTHRDTPYLFEVRDWSDWMTRYFFAGGMMPSDDLYAQFHDALTVERDWTVNGTHYARTARAWRENLERAQKPVRALFAQIYGAGEVSRWWAYWRTYLLACEELWAYRGGDEWHVKHYRFRRSDLA